MEMKTVWSLRSEEIKAMKVLQMWTGSERSARLIWLLQRLPSQSLQVLESEELSPPPLESWCERSIELEEPSLESI